MVKAPDCESGEWEFKSPYSPYLNKEIKFYLESYDKKERRKNEN